MKKYWEMWVVTIINWIWHETEKKKVRHYKKKKIIYIYLNTHQFQMMRLSYQLNGGEVLLPPEVLLVVGAHGRQAIVSVHKNMDDTV